MHRTRLGDLVKCIFWLRGSARLTLSRGLWPPLGPPSVSTDSSSRTGVGSWGQPWNQTAPSPVQVAQVSLSLLPARRPRRDTGPGHGSHPSGCLCFSRIHHVESGRQQGGVRRGESRGDGACPPHGQTSSGKHHHRVPAGEALSTPRAAHTPSPLQTGKPRPRDEHVGVGARTGARGTDPTPRTLAVPNCHAQFGVA